MIKKVGYDIVSTSEYVTGAATPITVYGVHSSDGGSIELLDGASGTSILSCTGDGSTPYVKMFTSGVVFKNGCYQNIGLAAFVTIFYSTI